MRGSPVQPDILPVLSVGKHRNPRRGACFMEFASFLAGEAWSDHPACTHPGLAHLARMVNDCTTDAGRQRLAPLIPSVIGLTSDDPRLDIVLALRAACAALPIASEDRQRPLAVGALVCAHRLERMGDPGIEGLAAAVRSAFDGAPAALRWGRNFIDVSVRREPATMSPRHCQAITAVAIDGIGRACVEDPDDRLYRLLCAAIDDTAAFVARTASEPEPVREEREAKPAPVLAGIFRRG